jgi:hypothetical protein
VPQYLERYPALTMHLQSFCSVIAGRAIAIVGVILLASCATPYQPKGFTGGFSETPLSENTFRVYFRGNGYTGEERAEDFTLLRSAQLAEEHGFPYFIIVDENSASSLAAMSTPTQSYTTASATSVGGTTYGMCAGNPWERLSSDVQGNTRKLPSNLRVRALPGIDGKRL